MDTDYNRLKIESNSSDEEIKKAYQARAKILHPDKGGNTTEFQKLNESYDKILKQRKKTSSSKQISFHDSFLQRDYMNMALHNRFQRMESFKEMIEKDLMDYSTNFYSESSEIIKINGKQFLEKKINHNGEIKIERYKID